MFGLSFSQECGWKFLPVGRGDSALASWLSSQCLQGAWLPRLLTLIDSFQVIALFFARTLSTYILRLNVLYLHLRLLKTVSNTLSFGAASPLIFCSLPRGKTTEFYFV